MNNDLYQNYTTTSTSFHGNESFAFDMYKDMYKRHISMHIPDTDPSNLTILDIGCGWGGLLKVLQQEGYSQAEGFDLSPEQIKTARSLNIKNVSVNTIEDFFRKSTKETYDIVLLFDVLEHFPSQEGVNLMKSIYTVLKPKGKVILQVPNGASLISLNFYSDITHFKAFTSTSLHQVAKMAGFDKVTCTEALPYLPWKKRILSRFLWYFWIKPLSRAYMLATVGNSGGKVYTPNIISIWEK